MAKRKFKKYSTQDKVNYHKKRINDKSLSEDKRYYSRTWLSGFLDRHADYNSKVAKREYSDRKIKGKVSKDEHIMYQATIRGTTERAKLKPDDYYIEGLGGDPQRMIRKKYGISQDDLLSERARPQNK